ncbi:MAG: hypothetical protein ACI9ON_002066 [Limisphaerales bacterium]
MVNKGHLRQLELFTTAHCALCDEVMAMLLGMPNLAGWRITTRDVALDDALFQKYAERIPVLRHGDRELAAPFTQQELEAWTLVG